MPCLSYYKYQLLGPSCTNSWAVGESHDGEERYNYLSMPSNVLYKAKDEAFASSRLKTRIYHLPEYTSTRKK